MKNAFLNIYRCIVGSEYGFAGEGNEQWYYTLALAINLMLVWWLKPEVALTFTILAAIHYVTVFVYGFEGLSDYGAGISYAYLGSHVILLAIGIFTSFKWAMIMILIVIIALILAPDCTGNNIFLRKPNVNNQLPLVFHTIMFVTFLVIDLLLPIKLWMKLAIITVILVLHPIIDMLEGDCVNIVETTEEALENIKEK